MKFAHTGDCHLGGWRQPEMIALNLKSLSLFVDTCLKEKVEFVLIAGDFFDSAYPPIEAIKTAFDQLRRLKEAQVPVFIIAGSHDYSASGKSFIDVLEKADFVKNASRPELRDNFIYLSPLVYKGVAIYGYPGKRSALEVEDIKRIKLHESPGMYTILMLHTALRDAVGNLPIPAVDQDKLPKVNYLALAHLHVKYEKNSRVYCGPLFPNSVAELEELGGGSFYIVDTNGKTERREINLNPVITIDLPITDTTLLMDEAQTLFEKQNLKDSILILRLTGVFENGLPASVRLAELEQMAKKKGAYAVLKNTSGIKGAEGSFLFASPGEELEETIIKRFKEEHDSELNHLIEPLLHTLEAEKKEEEKSALFEERLYEDFRKAVHV